MYVVTIYKNIFFISIVMSNSSNSTLKNMKTIMVNEDLFKYNNHSKTSKKERKPIIPAIVKPNSLKKQLLNRIKEHKIKENLIKNQTQQQQQQQQQQQHSNDTFNDEFNESINYLSSLSKKVKQDYEKKNYEKKLANKTLKNHSHSFSNPYVETELPDDLLVTCTSLVQNSNNSFEYKVDNNVPYGCLKNGKKPTYKMWQQQTKKNNFTQPSHPNQPNQRNQPNHYQSSYENISNSQTNNNLSYREKKIELLKQKMKQESNMYCDTSSTPNLSVEVQKFSPLTSKQESYETPITSLMNASPLSLEEAKNRNTIAGVPLEQDSIETMNPSRENKKITKRIIKKKYTLGKSKIHKKVGVLIKNNETRKKIIDAHKDLKKKPLNEIKKYLKEHGLLKAGSDAPSDVLRKTYECAYLAGDIVNYDKDIIIHNFLNDERN
jgi:hypothetical protein